MEIGHFLTILGKTYILSNQSNIFTKKVQKSDWNWILNLFCKFFWLIWPNIPFSQNCPKMTKFHITKSKKWVKFLFCHKIQNAHSIWFPHKFSILKLKVTPMGPLDAPDPHWPVFEVLLGQIEFFLKFFSSPSTFMHFRKGLWVPFLEMLKTVHF